MLRDVERYSRRPYRMPLRVALVILAVCALVVIIEVILPVGGSRLISSRGYPELSVAWVAVVSGVASGFVLLAFGLWAFAPDRSQPSA
ncbi:hypothetical protein [Paramicrobacterium chengjingii]|uniref:Uncharacterized protein n=1 Tax=Paramicrobacterium chengjingii TaxID=2769067 RepID=A0ABX6YIL8_9MICO|nr:hypothetical protein [Microbacterium chengjingii]QPZ38555.1 hypothetical protein HCR76_00090 [Microbacterium chengjingii]